MKYFVVIPAAGKGKRMKAGLNKLLLELEGKPVIIHTLEVFESDPCCKGIVLSVHPDEQSEFEQLLLTYNIKKVCAFAMGGQERQHSVYSGLKVLPPESDIVLVHDGARPFITRGTIEMLVKSAHDSGAAIAAVPVKDTIKKAASGTVSKTIDRASLWSVQTPQAFKKSVLLHAQQKAEEEQFLGTDESSLVERTGYRVQIVESDYDNIKLTTPEDMYFARAIIAKRMERQV
ncbi:2-C-methyl-D-erythritol 4-phosphate cytidylyltransferase [Domibacillus epiphyticus]|uniref:2-C-methyl-D-erythritol 4-phosphate cytidylyltransferase n=1 Tax=Domibacillus epiphyticus TaxID=1714355 RepID=A0A1V2AAF7_9BACI|nr:2-C-methyl-D-erythritol 4-phosphate cytidylyltransferase [Domibacillus epiphyticus]OMP67971.1 2-C-methyl-D-erythritol 4-phosphate cytidylyltransferase [Domibacillus epiphyticus]